MQEEKIAPTLAEDGAVRARNIIKEKRKTVAPLVFSAVCLLLVVGWLVYAVVSPVLLQRQAEKLLGREDVVATDSLHTPWLYVAPDGVIHIKRERLRGASILLPDVMDGVKVTGAVSTTGGAAYGIEEISFPSDIDSMELWHEHYPDLGRVIFRDGVALDKQFTLRRMTSQTGIEVYLPREIAELDSDAFRGSHADTVILYEGTEQEWLAYGAEAEELAATYTVRYESTPDAKKIEKQL